VCCSPASGSVYCVNWSKYKQNQHSLHWLLSLVIQRKRASFWVTRSVTRGRQVRPTRFALWWEWLHALQISTHHPPQFPAPSQTVLFRQTATSFALNITRDPSQTEMSVDGELRPWGFKDDDVSFSTDVNRSVAFSPSDAARQCQYTRHV